MSKGDKYFFSIVCHVSLLPDMDGAVLTSEAAEMDRPVNEGVLLTFVRDVGPTSSHPDSDEDDEDEEDDDETFFFFFREWHVFFFFVGEEVPTVILRSFSVLKRV